MELNISCGLGAIVKVMLFFSEKWGNECPASRLRIRDFIKDKCKGDSSLLDLSEVPRYIRGRYVSISHCATMGVVAISEFPIGVDIEAVRELPARGLSLVASAAEIRSAPSHMSLWCAKEAAFKACFEWGQPTSLSEVLIHGWEDFVESTYSFKSRYLEGPIQFGGGMVWQEREFVFAVYCFVSKTTY